MVPEAAPPDPTAPAAVVSAAEIDGVAGLTAPAVVTVDSVAEMLIETLAEDAASAAPEDL